MCGGLAPDHSCQEPGTSSSVPVAGVCHAQLHAPALCPLRYPALLPPTQPGLDCTRYNLRIDYRTAPPPPNLSPADAAWLDKHLAAAGWR